MKTFYYSFEGIEVNKDLHHNYEGTVYLRPDNTLHTISIDIFFNDKFNGYTASMAGNGYNKKMERKDYKNRISVTHVEEEYHWIITETTDELESLGLYIYLVYTDKLEKELRKFHDIRKSKNFSNRNCSSCRYKTSIEAEPEDKEDYDINSRFFCRLRGEYIDRDWMKEIERRKVEDRGLVDSKSKTTFDKEHPFLAPIAGRARVRGLINEHEKVVENESCIAHIYKFQTKEKEWVVMPPSKFPWFKQIGSEIELYINYYDSRPDDNTEESNDRERINVAKIVIENVTPEKMNKEVTIGYDYLLNDNTLLSILKAFDKIENLTDYRKMELAQKFIDSNPKLEDKLTARDILKQLLDFVDRKGNKLDRKETKENKSKTKILTTYDEDGNMKQEVLKK